MVLVLGGVVLDEAPIDSRNLFHAAPHLKDAAGHVASLPPKVVSSIGLLYLHQREFAVTLPHDSRPLISCALFYHFVSFNNELILH